MGMGINQVISIVDLKFIIILGEIEYFFVDIFYHCVILFSIKDEHFSDYYN